MSGGMERYRYNGARHSRNQCDSALAIIRHECDVKIETQRGQYAVTGKAELRNKEVDNVRKKAES